MEQVFGITEQTLSEEGLGGGRVVTEMEKKVQCTVVVGHMNINLPVLYWFVSLKLVHKQPGLLEMYRGHTLIRLRDNNGALHLYNYI